MVAEVYPAALDKVTLAERAGYEASGGGFNNALGKLRTLELIHGRNDLRASDALYEWCSICIREAPFAQPL